MRCRAQRVSAAAFDICPDLSGPVADLPRIGQRETVPFSTDDIIYVKEGSKVPRRGSIAKRDVLPDPLYNSKLVTRLINNVMVDGKRGVAQKIVYGASTSSGRNWRREPLEVFEQAMENIMPQLEVKARRVGGATYQVPIEVRPDRRQTLGLRWLTAYSRSRSERTMRERLAAEILDAVNGNGGAAKEAGRHAQDGGSQPRVRPLQMVSPIPAPPRHEDQPFSRRCRLRFGFQIR